MTVPVIALPGGVMPAALRYATLASTLAGEIELHTKDLEVYSGEEPPRGYGLEHEVRAVARLADSLGLDRFHLLGYSGGGFVSLAFVGTYPDRVASLALFEPAGVPGPLSPQERELADRLQERLAGLDGSAFMDVFTRTQVRDGVDLPAPAGPPSPWMRTRPAGLRALMAAFRAYRFDRTRLRECRFPVYLGYGDLTGEYEEVKAAVLAQLLPDLHIRRFTGLHHFLPPEQIYTPEHVHALRQLWNSVDATLPR
jgi:pimeloyl-ACP methyl ester carboxylesterase